MNESAAYIGAAVCNSVSTLSGLSGVRCYDAASITLLGYSLMVALLIAFCGARALRRC